MMQPFKIYPLLGIVSVPPYVFVFLFVSLFVYALSFILYLICGDGPTCQHISAKLVQSYRNSSNPFLKTKIFGIRCLSVCSKYFQCKSRKPSNDKSLPLFKYLQVFGQKARGDFSPHIFYQNKIKQNIFKFGKREKASTYFDQISFLPNSDIWCQGIQGG